jgi:hypothetical protein
MDEESTKWIADFMLKTIDMPFKFEQLNREFPYSKVEEMPKRKSSWIGRLFGRDRSKSPSVGPGSKEMKELR